MNENIEIGSKLAKYFNKKNGVILYSGTLAMEAALICSKVSKNDKVLISGAACYTLIEAIIRLEAIPVIVIPKNSVFLTKKELSEAISDDIKCVIIVHQYGIVQNVLEIKKMCNSGTIIIEDVSQTWELLDNGSSPGIYSDYVITSFGKTKPLGLGYGGAIFSNDILRDKFDFYDNDSRNAPNILISYTYPLCKMINVRKLIKLAKTNVYKQRNIAKILTNGLKNNKKVTILQDTIGNKSCWHRFPLFINDAEYYEKIINILNDTKIGYQLPHLKSLVELNMFKNNKIVVIDKTVKKDIVILIRTRSNSAFLIKAFLKKIKES